MKLLVLALCLITQSGNVDGTPHTVVINSSQNGQTVDVHVGDEVDVTFEGSGTKAVWELEPLARGAVVGKVRFELLRSGLPLGVVKTIFHVPVTKAGTVTLKFDWSEPSVDSTPPSAEFRVTLRATAN
jgi:hypothetical protein